MLQASQMSFNLAILPSYSTDFLALKCLSVFAGSVKPLGRGALETFISKKRYETERDDRRASEVIGSTGIWNQIRTPAFDMSLHSGLNVPKAGQNPPKQKILY